MFMRGSVRRRLGMAEVVTTRLFLQPFFGCACLKDDISRKSDWYVIMERFVTGS